MFKKDKNYLLIFLSIVLLCIIYCICIFPSYVLEKKLMYNDMPWTSINAHFKHSNLKRIYLWLRYKIPEETIFPVILINIGNAIFGFIKFKNKWWYYLILAISILCSVFLLDYYEIYTYDDV